MKGWNLPTLTRAPCPAHLIVLNIFKTTRNLILFSFFCSGWETCSEGHNNSFITQKLKRLSTGNWQLVKRRVLLPFNVELTVLRVAWRTECTYDKSDEVSWFLANITESETFRTGRNGVIHYSATLGWSLKTEVKERVQLYLYSPSPWHVKVWISPVSVNKNDVIFPPFSKRGNSLAAILT